MPWLTLIPARVWLAIGAAAAIVFGGWYLHHAGAVAEAEKWQKKVDAAESEWRTKIDGINDENRATETRLAEAMQRVAANYAKERENVETQRREDHRNVSAGGLVFYDRAADSARSADAGKPAATACGCDGSERGKLSGAVTDDLLDLAADADRNTIQLTACQAVIDAYRS